ncbi:MAG: hemolysin III family protein [Streptosporangiales bacterium]|nr:hemolysin III family protein [Streptosporangiales bacterium]
MGQAGTGKAPYGWKGDDVPGNLGTELVRALKPRLRGWLHLAACPPAVAAGVVLICLAPTGLARLGAAIYTATSALLFGISALYHRGHWSGRGEAVLRRLDHANIYLIIAGTYTPFALLVLEGGARIAVLTVVWGGATAGVIFRVAWLRAPRWLSTLLYVALGWAAVFVLPDLARGAGSVVLTLVVLGGVLYSVGGLIYALRRPDPWPRWFGFHEVFHSLTVVAYAAQAVAVFLVTFRAA